MENGFDLPYSIGDYSLDEYIGEGSFSKVYKAHHVNRPGVFAVKTMEKGLLSRAEDQTRFQRELDCCAFLKHDNVISLLEFLSNESYFFVVLDYCEGGDLFRFINDREDISEPQAAGIFYQIVSGISYCHSRGVAHRDLKPQNILFTMFPYLKITDFGLCGYHSIDQKMKTFCGSPYYAAPECLNHINYNGFMSDIWSMGVILYELVTGEHPWSITNTNLMIKQISRASFSIPTFVSPECTDLIKSLLRVNPSDRLTCDAILLHPWMRMATITKPRDRSSLPPLYKKQIPFITKSIDRSSVPLDHGIASPLIGLPNSLMRESFSHTTQKYRPIKRSNSGHSINPIISDTADPSPLTGTASIVAPRRKSSVVSIFKY